MRKKVHPENDVHAETLGPAETAALRRRRWIGRRAGAHLARCTERAFVAMCRRGDFGDNPDRPARRRVAEYRLSLDPPSPYLDSLVFDHVLVAGSPAPEVSEWGNRYEHVIVEHHHTLVEAVARAVELKVVVALAVNDVTAGRAALFGTAVVARRHFPDAALFVFGRDLPPDVASHGWEALPPDTADLSLNDLYGKFLTSMRPGGVFAGRPHLE